MERTADGDLLCVMRRGSAMPMVSCRSRDEGRTWSPPRTLPQYAVSVFPDMVLMSNGVLALSSGRPGIYIMFSADGRGEDWTSRTTLYEDAYYPTPASTCAIPISGRSRPAGSCTCTRSWRTRLNLVPSHMRGVFVDVKCKEVR